MTRDLNKEIIIECSQLYFTSSTDRLVILLVVLSSSLLNRFEVTPKLFLLLRFNCGLSIHQQRLRKKDIQTKKIEIRIERLDYLNNPTSSLIIFK